MSKTYSKYYIPALLVVGLFFAMCNSSDEKEAKLGKAGDQFDLFAVMSLFEKSASPEDFETAINTKANGVNNLDLNEDGQTDYIKVIDKKIDDNSHCFILQVDVAEGSTQDVATIEIQKITDSEANVQIIGDPELYGSDYIVEPKSNVAAAGFVVATTSTVNVWSWPYVTHVYSPSYVVYESPYRYEYYPVWYQPWPVVSYDVYYPTVSSHRVNYHYSDGYRFVNIHENYHNNYRVTSKFKYNEKDHGNGKPNGTVVVFKNKNDGSGNNGNGNDNGNGTGNGKGNSSGNNDGNGNDNGKGDDNGKGNDNENGNNKPDNNSKGNDGKSDQKKDQNGGEGNSGPGGKEDKSPAKNSPAPKDGGGKNGGGKPK